jgi:hypothetical protein
VTRIAGIHPLTGEVVIVRVRETPMPPPKAAPTTSLGKRGDPGDGSADVDRAGRFVAVFSTFSCIDHDGDVTLPSAFAGMEGKAVPLSAYGHSSWDGAVPIGSGTIHSTSTHAEIHGHLLMDTEAGRAMHSALKDHGSELSYGFTITRATRGTFRGEPVRFLHEVNIWEVSFVLRGAGLGTGLVELDAELTGLSPEAREAVIDFRRLEARIDQSTGKRRTPPDVSRTHGYKVPPRGDPTGRR